MMRWPAGLACVMSLGLALAAPAPAQQPLELGALAGIWVPVDLHPGGCAPSPTGIASSNLAIRVVPDAILMHERQCRIEFTAPQPDGSLRVGTRCRSANLVDAPVMTLSVAQERLTVRDRDTVRTYARCPR